MKGIPAAAALLLAPAVLLLASLFIAPLAVLFRFSLDQAKPGGVIVPAFVADNYHRFLFDPFYLRILWTTVRLALWVTLLCAILGYPVAYYLARVRSRGIRALGITALLIPLMTSVVVRSYGWSVIFFAVQGVVSRVFTAVGIPAEFARLAFTPRGVIVALVEVLLPFMILSILPVLQSVDPVLEQASQTLGAGSGTTFRRVLLPLSMPGLTTGAVLVFVLAVNSFATPSLVGGSSIQVVSIFIYNEALALFNWPFGAAAAIILLALVLLLIWGHEYAVAGRRKTPVLS